MVAERGRGCYGVFTPSDAEKELFYGTFFQGRCWRTDTSGNFRSTFSAAAYNFSIIMNIKIIFKVCHATSGGTLSFLRFIV
jgi:hypothetical protein